MAEQQEIYKLAKQLWPGARVYSLTSKATNLNSDVPSQAAVRIVAEDDFGEVIGQCEGSDLESLTRVLQEVAAHTQKD